MDIKTKLRQLVISPDNVNMVYNALDKYLKKEYDFEIGDHFVKQTQDTLLQNFEKELDIQDINAINPRQFIIDVGQKTLDMLIEQFTDGHFNKDIGKDITRTYEDELRNRGYDIVPPKAPATAPSDTISDETTTAQFQLRPTPLAPVAAPMPPAPVAPLAPPTLLKTSSRDFFNNKLSNPLFMRNVPTPAQNLSKVVMPKATSLSTLPYLFCAVIRNMNNTMYQLTLEKSVENFLYYSARRLYSEESTETIDQIQLLDVDQELYRTDQDMFFETTDPSMVGYGIEYGADIQMDSSAILDITGGKKSDKTTIIEYNNVQISPQHLTLYEFLQTQTEITVEYQKSKRNILKKTVDILEVSPSALTIEKVDGLAMTNLLAVYNREISYQKGASDAAKSFAVSPEKTIYYEFN